MVNFRTEKVTERVTRIYGICTELMYLVTGEERAALIDTGSGFGSLKEVVAELTDKPVIVLLTHGHTDHAMGTAEFETVYMNHEDDYIFGPHGEESFRWEGVAMSSEYPLVDRSDYIPTDDLGRFHSMKEGDIFDLGGISIEIYSCPGHTRGSLVMLIREERMLLLGDACNQNTFLFEDYSLPVAVYENSLKRLKVRTDGAYDTVLASHGDGKLPADIIEGVIQVCKDIREGRADDVPMTFRGNHGLIAKRVKEGGEVREDGGSGNIVYSRERIYENL